MLPARSPWRGAGTTPLLLRRPLGLPARQASGWGFLEPARKRHRSPWHSNSLGMGEPVPCAAAKLLHLETRAQVCDELTCGGDPCQTTLYGLKWKA